MFQLKSMRQKTITMADVRLAVEEAYGKYRDVEVDGDVDPRLKDVDADRFGISVMLADGTCVEVGDTDVMSPLGGIAAVPVMSVLCMQYPEAMDGCPGRKCSLDDTWSEKPERMPVSVDGVRMVSGVEPKGDPEGKWTVMMDTLAGLVSTPPVLDDALYESMSKTNAAANVEKAMADVEFFLYDDADISIDLYTRMTAMCMSTRQLAEMGATLAAGGCNPESGAVPADALASGRVSAFMAVTGPRHKSEPWLIRSGLPARNSFGGSMLGVLPGVLAIAAYSPMVSDDGVSVKAFMAIGYIMRRLGLGAFSGEYVTVEK